MFKKPIWTLPESLHFSWKLDYTWIKMLFVAIAPGVIVSIFTNNLLWLTSSFFAVCSIRPYTISHNSRLLTFVHAVLMGVIIYFIDLALKFNWMYLLLILPAVALIAGSIDNIHKDLRSFSSWLIIGGVYGGVKLYHYSLNIEQLFILIILTLFSIGLVVFLFSKTVKPIKFQLIMPSDPKFIFNFKYILPVTIAVFIWHIFDLQEPQWIFWSSLSVVYPELDDTILKLKQRSYGVLIGALFGLIIGLILPNSIIITYICFIMIMLSLKMFQDYFPGFLFRCFFVVLYAGNLSSEIALIRLSNVVIGGLIGTLCTLLLIKIYSSQIFNKFD